MAPGTLLLLTGSPGSGKTTVAPLVADRQRPSACLDLDWFFAKLRRGAVEPWEAAAHQQNRVVLTAAAEAVSAFAQGGYFTVAEGILYPFMLDLFAVACEPHRITLNYAVLRAPIGTVQQRVQDRRAEPVHAGALGDAERGRRPVGPVRGPGGRRAPPGRPRAPTVRRRWPRRSTAGSLPATSVCDSGADQPVIATPVGS